MKRSLCAYYYKLRTWCCLYLVPHFQVCCYIYFLAVLEMQCVVVPLLASFCLSYCLCSLFSWRLRSSNNAFSWGHQATKLSSDHVLFYYFRFRLSQSIPTKLSDAMTDNEGPRKSEGHRFGTIGKTEIQIENCEPETKFSVSFSFFFFVDVW